MKTFDLEKNNSEKCSINNSHLLKLIHFMNGCNHIDGKIITSLLFMRWFTNQLKRH